MGKIAKKIWFIGGKQKAYEKENSEFKTMEKITGNHMTASLRNRRGNMLLTDNGYCGET